MSYVVKAGQGPISYFFFLAFLTWQTKYKEKCLENEGDMVDKAKRQKGKKVANGEPDTLAWIIAITLKSKGFLFCLFNLSLVFIFFPSLYKCRSQWKGLVI